LRPRDQIRLGRSPTLPRRRRWRPAVVLRSRFLKLSEGLPLAHPESSRPDFRPPGNLAISPAAFLAHIEGGRISGLMRFALARTPPPRARSRSPPRLTPDDPPAIGTTTPRVLFVWSGRPQQRTRRPPLATCRPEAGAAQPSQAIPTGLRRGRQRAEPIGRPLMRSPAQCACNPIY
jgi:hypothetical protein